MEGGRTDIDGIDGDVSRPRVFSMPGLKGGVGLDDLIVNVVERVAGDVDERAIIVDLAFPDDGDDVGVWGAATLTGRLLTGKSVGERA